MKPKPCSRSLRPKIFLHTSEPRAAKWISDTIGEVEMERFKESLNSDSSRAAADRGASTRSGAWSRWCCPRKSRGLPRLHALVKVDNLVVPFSFPYIELPKREAAFIERETKPQQLKEKSTPGTIAPASSVPAQEQRPREIEPIAEKTKAAAAEFQRAAAVLRIAG